VGRTDFFVLVVVPVLVIESGSKNEDEDGKENEEDTDQLATLSRQRDASAQRKSVLAIGERRISLFA
jgi:hypothetical protein